MAMILRMVDEEEPTEVARRMWAKAQDGTDRLMVVRWDVADDDLVDRHNWYVRQHPGGDFYAEHRGGSSKDPVRMYTTMHALIMGDPPEPGLRVGHISGNGLDNRRRNLRWMTQEQILAKRRPPRQTGGRDTYSRYKGVTWDSRHRRWVATFRGTRLGRFTDEREAAAAFDRAAFERWGSLAYLNFPSRVGHAAGGDSAATSVSVGDAPT